MAKPEVLKESKEYEQICTNCHMSRVDPIFSIFSFIFSNSSQKNEKGVEDHAGSVIKKESQPPSPLFNRILIQKVIQQIQRRPPFHALYVNSRYVTLPSATQPTPATLSLYRPRAVYARETCPAM